MIKREDISVLLPVRNAEATISRAVKSTLVGLSKTSELLIFDDGSSDETAEKLADIRDPRVRVHRDANVSGVAGGLNYLLDVARNPVIARMDGDDVALPTRFSMQLNEIQSGRADVSFGSVVHFGESRLPRPSAPIRLDSHLLAMLLLISNPVAHSTMLGLASVIKASGGYKQGPAEDYDLWLRVAEAGYSLTKIRMPVVAYRHHAEQLTKSRLWESARDADPGLQSGITAVATRLAPRWTDAAVRIDDLHNWGALNRQNRRKMLLDTFGDLRRSELIILHNRITAENARLRKAVM